MSSPPGTYVLYTIPCSLYSGKARSYLRKHRIEHEERFVGDQRYQSEILPAIGRLIMPVLETPDGVVIQDNADIIDHFDRGVPPERSIYPQGPRQRAVAHVLELFGGEGMLRPAMHYRWSFDEDNLDFVFEEFSLGLVPGAEEQVCRDVFAWASEAMREVARVVGVTPESIPAIDRSYAEFLALFSAHLRTTPYLLGGRPTIADYGLMAPLYAHLSRDPYPSRLMKRTAPRVWRWVERMNAPHADIGEYPGHPRELLADDAIPATLDPLLEYVREEHLGEMLAQVAFIDRHLAEHEEIREGDVLAYDIADRWLGHVTFDWRGQELTVGVLPYRILVLQRLQDAVAAFPEADRAAARAELARHGLQDLLDVRPRRRLERRDNREAWGAQQAPVLALEA